MLPDYPKIKARLREVYLARIRHAHNVHLGIMADVPATQIHEGAKHILFREDGSTDDIEPQLMEAGAELKLNYQEVEKLEPEEVWKLLDTIGEGLATEKAKLFLERLDEAVKQVGNVIDSKQPAVEQQFQAIEKIYLDFDKQGHPQLPTLCGGSVAMEKMTEAMQQIQSTPDLRRRYEALIEKKREEWRDREAARNLVE